MSFADCFVAANKLRERGFSAWALHPGMRFGAAKVWWGDEASRTRPHEGVDLYRYLDAAGQPHCLGPGALIPSVLPGKVAGLFPDLIAQSLLMIHEDLHQEGRQLYSIVAHVEVAPHVVPGQDYPGGTMVARLFQSRRARVPAHLHVSLLVAGGPLPQPLTWPRIVSSDDIRFLDPELYLDLGACHVYSEA